MSKTQYTIRSIPPKVDQALRSQAKKTGKSLNEIAIEALAKGAGVTPDSTFNDLDWFIGNKSIDDKSFNDALNWLDSLPKDM
jgi:hypothetical protein